jgi:hypothetical protein
VADVTKTDFAKLMRFPGEWILWDLYPDELFEAQFRMYRPDDENGAEHDRNGAFHWWLKRNPGVDVLEKLYELTLLDEDQVMAGDARRHISEAINRSERDASLDLPGRRTPFQP